MSPLTAKGKKIKRAMTKRHAAKKGERVFFASANKGTITGVHGRPRKQGAGRKRHTAKKAR